MKRETSSSNKAQGWLIVFCGSPGTLKSYLSVRLSGRLGYAYLPTRCVGAIADGTDARTLQDKRMRRYEAVAEVAHAATELGANIVVDGGFETAEARAKVLEGTEPNKTVIVYCRCDDEEVRLRRLEIRSKDALDYEFLSAQEILHASREGVPTPLQDDPEMEILESRADALLVVDTAKMTLQWKGHLSENLRARIQDIMNELLQEYEVSQIPHALKSEIRAHFDELAAEYDSSTEWRQDDRLLSSLRRPLSRCPSRVLDVGTGTGLAGEWYRDQGHYVVGIDLSPVMLRKAAERLTLTLLGNSTQLPFIDNYFDLVIIRQCLHYTNPTQLLIEANRVLKRDGLLVMSGSICPDERTRTLWEEFKAVTQPLRLRVFTEDDFVQLLEGAGLIIQERLRHVLTRQEKSSCVNKRAPSPAGGWSSFFSTFENISLRISPKLEFSFDGDRIKYRQFWVTIWARKENHL